eukprot:TRINITY_DN14993_c0_g1_i1.p1 TRINITY_DN14993_c0_g1~~TRINITY_DN14993_c0_g1_i1.p1  ORF type:complete len:350 (+),score=25.63 TRINITY_DN14993_c0_g1_i1:70-1119(+)
MFHTMRFYKTQKKVNNCNFHWCWLNIHLVILLVLSIVWGPFFFWAAQNSANENSVGALLVSMFILFTLITRLVIIEEKHLLLNDLLICVLLGLTIPLFFTAVGPVVINHSLEMNDLQLLTIDKWLLGGFFPEGQIALWMDKSEFFNPTTFLGKLITEILQISYTSYYFWGYCTLLILMWRYAQAYLKGQSSDVKLVQLKMYICAWLFAYYLNFLVNLAIPAKSPRIYMKEKYSHPLTGFGLASYLRTASTDDRSFGTFPSGHVGESFVAASYAVRFFGKFGKASAFAAAMITLATVMLRYHYFVDILGAIPIIIISLLYGLFLPSERYTKYVEEATLRDLMVSKDLEKQ